MDNIDFGRIAFVFEGDWDGNRQYSRLSTVRYSIDGCGYVAVKDNRGVMPGGNLDVWMKIVDKGDKGDKGDEPQITLETDAQGNVYLVVDGVRVTGPGGTQLSFKGPKGDKGDKPTITAKKFGSAYYWAVDGNFVVDGNGNKIPAIAIDTEILSSSTREFKTLLTGIASPKEGDTCISPTTTSLTPSEARINLTSYAGKRISISAIPVPVPGITVPEMTLSEQIGDTVSMIVIDTLPYVSSLSSGAEFIELSANTGTLSGIVIEVETSQEENRYIYLDGTWKSSSSIGGSQDVSGKEDKTNKVTSLSASSTNTQYPSAKCVYDAISASRDIFVATYGSTSYADILGAVNSGKITFCKHSGGQLYTFRVEDFDGIHFVSIDSALNTIRRVTVASDNTWSSDDVNFIPSSVIDTSISSSSLDTHVPSSKCVYDIVGNIETLLAALL